MKLSKLNNDKSLFTYDQKLEKTKLLKVITKIYASNQLLNFQII